MTQLLMDDIVRVSCFNSFGPLAFLQDEKLWKAVEFVSRLFCWDFVFIFLFHYTHFLEFLSLFIRDLRTDQNSISSRLFSKALYLRTIWTLPLFSECNEANESFALYSSVKFIRLLVFLTNSFFLQLFLRDLSGKLSPFFPSQHRTSLKK